MVGEEIWQFDFYDRRQTERKKWKERKEKEWEIWSFFCILSMLIHETFIFCIY